MVAISWCSWDALTRVVQMNFPPYQLGMSIWLPSPWNLHKFTSPLSPSPMQDIVCQKKIDVALSNHDQNQSPDFSLLPFPSILSSVPSLQTPKPPKKIPSPFSSCLPSLMSPPTHPTQPPTVRDMNATPPQHPFEFNDFESTPGCLILK